MNVLSFAPEIATATLGAVRPLSNLAVDGARQFADLLSPLSSEEVAGVASPGATQLPFSSGSLQRRLADQIASGELNISELLNGASDGGADSSIEISDLAAWAEKQLASLHERIAQKLQQSGVDWNEGIELAVRPTDGSIVLASEHTQRRAIEETFANDAELSREVHQVLAALDLLRAASGNQAFVRDYQVDPHQAIARHESLFAPHGGASSRLALDQFSLRLA